MHLSIDITILTESNTYSTGGPPTGAYPPPGNPGGGYPPGNAPGAYPTGNAPGAYPPPGNPGGAYPPGNQGGSYPAPCNPPVSYQTTASYAPGMPYSNYPQNPPAVSTTSYHPGVQSVNYPRQPGYTPGGVQQSYVPGTFIFSII